MILDIIFHLLELTFGFIFPIYFSLNIIDKKKVECTKYADVSRWLTYWISLVFMQTFIFPIFQLGIYILPPFRVIFKLAKLALIMFIGIPQLEACEQALKLIKTPNLIKNSTIEIKKIVQQNISKFKNKIFNDSNNYK